MLKVHFRTRIEIRLALLVGLIGIALAVVQSAIIAYLDFQNQRHRLQIQAQAMLEASAASAARAVFELNEKAAQELLRGFSFYDYIIMGRVEDELGNTLAEFQKKDHIKTVDGFWGHWLQSSDHTYTTQLKDPNTGKPGFGTLSVQTNTAALIQPLRQRALNHFWIGLINALILLWVIWLIVHLYVALPLARLANKVKEIGETRWDLSVGVHRNDAIGALAAAINRMQQQLKTSFEELSISETRYRTLFNSTTDAISVHDARTGATIDVNQTMLDMFGYARQEIGEMTLERLSAGDNQHNIETAAQLIQKTLTLGPQMFEWHTRRKNGELFWVEVALKSTEIEGEGRLLAVVRDITERRAAAQDKEQLEQQLHQVQKIEAIGQLAGGVAHDFNNMLSVVLGYTEIVLMDENLSEQAHQMLNAILDSARRSSDLVSQLLAFARKQTVSPKTLNINDTIEGMLKMLRRLIGEDIDLIWMPSSIISYVLIDPSQIDQILANLVVNARDAISGVGRVTIETQKVIFTDSECATQSDLEPGPFVLLSISDTGCGMDAVTQEKIFEPFFTTKGVGQGTGLGLATVYGIVKQNHGTITIHSQPGGGSTFDIYLPEVEAKKMQDDDDKADKKFKKGSGTILIVEDDAAILGIGKRILEKLGYRVLAATSPQAAIEMVLATEQKIDLLLTDVIMPQMNGRQLAEKLTAQRPGLKVLYMSGYTADVIAHHGVLEEGVAYVQKPFTIGDLSARVTDVLENT